MFFVLFLMFSYKISMVFCFLRLVEGMCFCKVVVVFKMLLYFCKCYGDRIGDGLVLGYGGCIVFFHVVCVCTVYAFRSFTMCSFSLFAFFFFALCLLH